MGVRDGRLFHLGDFKSGRYGKKDGEAGPRWHADPIITKHLEEVRRTRSDRAVGRWILGNCGIGGVSLQPLLCYSEPPLLGLKP